jgi:hypothetical protein
VNDTTQIYDFNPGFGPVVNNADSGNGFGIRVFWTAVIPDSDFKINLGAGTGELNVSNLAEVNYYSPTGFAGNISLGPNWQTAGVDATVSFDVVWNGPVTRRVNVSDATDGFAGTFNEVNNNNVTVSWSGSNALGFSFTSNVGNQTTSVPANFFAQLAHEQNGSFFPSGTTGDAALVSALMASRATQVSAVRTPGAPPRKAVEPAPVTAGTAQAVQVALGVAQPGAGEANAKAIDHLFADRGNNPLADTL